MNWAKYFFSMVDVASQKSKDRATKVGAVIVGPDNEIRSVGYNGFPRGVDDEIDERHERPDKYLWTEHAERNAIYNAARAGIALKGCRIYQPYWPCSRCARGIIQVGIIAVIIPDEGYAERKAYWDERWAEDCKVSQEMLKEAGVDLLIQSSED